EQHLDVVALAREPAQHLAQLGDRFAVACVDRHRDTIVASLLERSDDVPQETHRQVVDAEKAVILEHLEGDGLARAGDAGDQHHSHGSSVRTRELTGAYPSPDSMRRRWRWMN